MERNWAEYREKQAENTLSIQLGEKHVRVQNKLSIEAYMSRVHKSTGELHVVEAEEFPEVLKQQENSLVAVFTDGEIVGFDKDSFVFGGNGEMHEPSYIAWVTTSFSRATNAFKDKPFSYHMVTREHTREDVSALLDKMGSRMEII